MSTSLVDDYDHSSFSSSSSSFCPISESDIPFLSNDNFFTGQPSYPQIPSSSSFDHEITKPRPTPLKRTVRIYTCRWCRRSADKLYFNAGCTFECTLTFFSKNYPILYNLVFIELCKHKLLEEENLQPLCIPPRDPSQSVEDYWRKTIISIYPEPTDVRRVVLLRNLIRRNDDFSENFKEETYQKSSRQRNAESPFSSISNRDDFYPTAIRQ
jgi:hypothetical protein